MFSFNKISNQKSTMFLYSLRGALSRGMPLLLSIEMLSKLQPKPLNKYLSKIVFLAKRRNLKIPDLMEKYGFINYNEKIILEKAQDAKFAINQIVEMRKIQDQFTSTLFKLTSFPAIVLIVMPLATNGMLTAFKKPIDNMMLILKSKGIDYQLQVPHYFYYIYHQNWLKYASVLSVLIVGGFFLAFFLLKYYNPKILYKFIRPVAYDDLPFILTYMSALNKVGIPIEKIADILANSSIKPGWKKFFKNLQRKIKKGEKIYNEFKKQYFPAEIVTYIQYDEIAGSFWDSIDSLKELTIERNKEINGFLLNQLKPITSYFTYAIIIYYLIGIVLLNMDMYNIANALGTGG